MGKLNIDLIVSSPRSNVQTKPLLCCRLLCYWSNRLWIYVRASKFSFCYFHSVLTMEKPEKTSGTIFLQSRCRYVVTRFPRAGPLKPPTSSTNAFKGNLQTDLGLMGRMRSNSMYGSKTTTGKHCLRRNWLPHICQIRIRKISIKNRQML